MLKHWLRGSQFTERSSRDSNVFTIEDDLSELDNRVRQNLEQHFRPVFQKFVYGGERIASHDLKRLLENEFYRDLLPPDKVYELVDIVDFNPGKAISYAEFYRIVTGDIDTGIHLTGSEKRLTDTPKTWLNVVCRNTVPQTEVDDHLIGYRWFPPPFFMITVSLVQFVIFIYYSVDMANRGDQMSAIDGVPEYSPMIYLPTKRQEPWRFITYIFLHQGVLDMLFNVCLQVIIGFPLEVMFGWWRMAIVYIVGFITGSLSQSVCDHYVGLAGAAGGCYAVVFGHIIAMIKNWSELDPKTKPEKRAKKWWGRPPFRLILILIAVLIQTCLAVFRRFYPDYPEFKVGIAAHVGGMVTGLLLGRPILADSIMYPWQQASAWVNFFTFIVFTAFCVIFNIVYDGYPEAE